MSRAFSRQFRLPDSVAAWGTDNFKQVLNDELASLPPDVLPLQQSLSQSSMVSNEPFKLVLIRCQPQDRRLHIKAGIFYTGIIAGCSCADDPTPLDTVNEYCEIELLIDLDTAQTHLNLLDS